MLSLTAVRFRRAQLDAVEHGLASDVSNEARRRAGKDPLSKFTVQAAGRELFQLLAEWHEDADTALHLLDHLHAFNGRQLLLYDYVQNAKHVEWMQLLLRILKVYNKHPVLEQRSLEDVFQTCERIPLDRIKAAEPKVLFVCFSVMGVIQCQ